MAGVALRAGRFLLSAGLGLLRRVLLLPEVREKLCVLQQRLEPVDNLVIIELLSSLYLIQRQIGASHNEFFKFYLRKKDGCIGNSVVRMPKLPKNSIKLT